MDQRRLKVQITDVLALRLLMMKHGASLFSDLSKHESAFVAPELLDLNCSNAMFQSDC